MDFQELDDGPTCSLCGFVGCSPSDFCHHQSWDLCCELQKIRKFFCHCIWRSISKDPIKHWQHHVQLLLLLLLSHVPGRVAQLGEETAQVHQAQGVVLRAALLLPRPPHDSLHHVHLGWLGINTPTPDSAFWAGMNLRRNSKSSRHFLPEADVEKYYTCDERKKKKV